MAAELYRPEIARLIIVGEAPPPARFFFYGDSLFFRHLRLTFADLLPEVERRDAGWFLALFRELGGWRTDVCETPQRANKGGSEEVDDCMEAFTALWHRQKRAEDALFLVSPKRLVPKLPDEIREAVTLAVAPPGQWNAHRESFRRDVSAALRLEFGIEGLREAAARVDTDDAKLDFDIARACAVAPVTDDTELWKLVRGHPREAALRAAWDRKD